MNATWIGLAVLLYILIRQVIPRRVSMDAPVILLGILGLLGVAGIAFGVKSLPHGLSLDTALVLVAMFPVACAAGWSRAYTIRLYNGESDQLMRQGTVLTILLWLVSFGVHYAMAVWTDHLAGGGLLGRASIYIYLAISLTTQGILLRRRARNYSSNVISGGGTRNNLVK